ncbi:hypothetical protein [Neobacillus sp. NPDC093127]
MNDVIFLIEETRALGSGLSAKKGLTPLRHSYGGPSTYPLFDYVN